MPRFLIGVALLMPAFSLPSAPPDLTIWLRRERNAPLPPRWVYSFGDRLEPRYIFGAVSLDQ